MKYRKKPVVIEAFQWTKGGHPEWFKAAIERGDVVRNFTPDGKGVFSLTIKTLEGDHRAKPGDFIIKGVKDELYPCREDIFRMTYDPVTEIDRQCGGEEK